jgi:cytochrome c oxidase accessory protein FixG
MNDSSTSVNQHDTEPARVDVAPVNAKQHRDLYKSRVKIFPKRVSGSFRSLKWWIMGVTLGIYYLAPWIRWDRGAFAPDQAILVDIANRRFYFFFIEIWPQEFVYLTGLLIMAGVALFLVTSTVGRAWCGYTCPQTVWVDLFLAVESWVDGDRNARMRLDKSGWTFDKIRKRGTKHLLWLIISIATGGAWIFYFADAPSLAYGFITGNAPAIAYTTVAILTATTYIFAGFMREQVCTYMCPWPRIQGAMIDEHSLIVTYQEWRGEPRSAHLKARPEDNAPAGDCIDCNQCVAVCPMGIDIRDGGQLECITCALCIDACDTVMEKIGRPKGLIAYSTSGAQKQAETGDYVATTWRTILHYRTLIYFAIWSFAGLAMLYGLLARDRLDVSVLHDRNPLFVILSDGSVRNGYTIKILNMLPEPRTFRLSLSGLASATMYTAEDGSHPSRHIDVDVPPDQLRSLRVLVRADTAYLTGESTSFSFQVREWNDEISRGGEAEQASYEAQFLAAP